MATHHGGGSLSERGPDGPADRALVARALARDGDALAALVARLTPVVQARVARRLLRRGVELGRSVRQEVEDLSQEVFLSLFADDGRVLASWEAGRGLSLDNFVGLVAERQAVSILRTGKRNPWKEDPTLTAELDGATTAPDPEVSASSRQTLSRLLDRLREELSPLGWRLFDLIFVQERSVAEVEGETGLSAAAVYAWRSRLRRLAGRLHRELSSDPAGAPRIPEGETT